MQRIIVEARSKFGVLDAQTKKWINTQDKSLLGSLLVGKAYDVTIGPAKGDDGKVRNQIVAAAIVNVDGNVATLEKPTNVKETSPKVEAPVKKAFVPRKAESDKAPAPAVDWAAKDRSQLVGGRSHDAVELVAASLSSCTPMSKVLELYKEALVGILKLSDEIK